ncbi:MAG: TonB-dependent receptor [candidate division Zixibacteria bacterium]
MRNLGVICILGVLLLSTPGRPESGLQVQPGGLIGTVVDTLTGEPLSWATVKLVGTQRQLKADASGRFEFANLAPDSYSLRVSRVGYESRILTNLTLASNQITQITVELTPKKVTVKSIVVIPGSYSIMGEEPVVHQTLSRAEIATVPQVGDDFFRAVRRLPGMCGTDYSSKFEIRGGEFEEVLVTLDGLEISEPFHMKDFDGGAVSVVDVATVEGVDLMTGGFPARYGDKMSGVFNIRSRSIPVDKTRISAGFSLSNFRALAEGSFGNGRGTWLMSARRGFIDLVLNLVGAADDLKPRYYDFFGKVAYQVNRNHVLNFDVLHAHDDLNFLEDDMDTLISDYGNTHAWINLHSMWHRRLMSRSIVSVSRLNHNRRGQEIDDNFNLPEHIISEEESSICIGLKTDWQYEASDQFNLEFGLHGRSLRARQDYTSRSFTYELRWLGDRWGPYLAQVDTTLVGLKPYGRKFAAYFSGRFNIDKSLIAEAGCRYDYASHTGDALGSPRVGLIYQVNPQTSLRAGWGKYYQTEGIEEISIVDGEDRFHPAQRADQYGVGLEHQFESGTQLRVEGYLKKYSRLRPDYRNSLSSHERFPERRYDRQAVMRESSTARGIEIYLKRDIGSRLSWYVSYAHAKVEDSVRSIYFPRTGVEDTYDQVLKSPRDVRNTFYLDLIYRPGPSWQLNLAFQYHTGWPYTSLHLERVEISPGTVINYIVPDKEWNARFEPFHRLDFRLNRFFDLAGGRLNMFLEVLNVYARENVRGYSYLVSGEGDDAVLLVEPEDFWFGILPSLGVSYEVEF